MSSRVAAGRGWTRCRILVAVNVVVVLLPVAGRSQGAPFASTQPREGAAVQAVPSAAASRPVGKSPYAVARDPDRPRSDLLMPLADFLLPGLDQWWEGQEGYAAFYSGLAAAGLLYAGGVSSANDLQHGAETRAERQRQLGDQNDKKSFPAGDKDVAQRKYQLGLLAYQGAGGMSALHAFRTAAATRRASGEYAFLGPAETPAKLYLAPLHFQYLARSSTWIPLTIGAALSYLQLSSGAPAGQQWATLTGADAGFAGLFSYNAGTHEEAVFRGWLMPVMREAWGSDFWSNSAQALLFAAAHLNSTGIPLPQLVLGYHLGGVAQANGWALGEGIFIHTWWDVMAFATLYSYKLRGTSATPSALPVFWLPPFTLAF